MQTRQRRDTTLGRMSKELGASCAVPQAVLRPLTSLAPYARNARTHSPAQIEQIGASMLAFGWTTYILADAQGIVAGHGRVLAAEKLNAAGEAIRFPDGTPIPPGMAPVVDCTGWTPTQRRAYILADNQIALNAGWDQELLKLELLDLKLEGFDLSVIGFGDQLTDLLEPGAGNELDPDDVPDLPETAFSQPGDLWVLGPHRVMCGDATNLGDWKQLCGSERLDIVWTDPPYNVAYESKLAGKIKNDSMSDGKFRELLLGIHQGLYSVMKEGAAIYVAHSDTEGLNFRSAFIEAGFKLSGCLIWRKDALVLGRSDFQWQHEPVLYGWKPGSKHRWYGGRKQTTLAGWGDVDPVRKLDDGRYQISVGDRVLVLESDTRIEELAPSVIFEPKPKRSSEHPTMKPVALIERHLRNNARAGDLVGDACGGSGSTLMAADRLGMSARLMELDPKFADVIVRRWQNYAGCKAVHAVTGQEFPE